LVNFFTRKVFLPLIGPNFPDLRSMGRGTVGAAARD
jgi:hypothetical protein